MRVGELVRFRSSRGPAIGMIIEISPRAIRGRHNIAVLWNGIGWDKLDGKIAWQTAFDIEKLETV